MRRKSILWFLLLICLAQFALFAGGKRESPTRHRAYVSMGGKSSVAGDTASGMAGGLGYEAAIGRYFSLGPYIGIVGGDGFGVDILAKPRVYFGSALEKFFIGADIGVTWGDVQYIEEKGLPGFDYYVYEPYFDFVAGLNLGYKFVFGRRSAGFTLEPSFGYDFFPNRFNFGLALGVAWGGNAGTAPAPRPVAVSTRDGIYIGIVSFGPNAEDLTGGGPILLDNEGYRKLMSSLERYQVDPSRQGTALFYATHLALANMKNAESRLPKKLDTVIVLTFTDGLDNASTALSLREINDPANYNKVEFSGGSIQDYMSFVKIELDSRLINNTGIEASVAGVKGIDVTNESAFWNSLKSLSTSNGKVSELANYSDLDPMFVNIANTIVNRWTETKFKMVTPAFPRGTKVRMTFGNERTPQQANNSMRYVEGEVTVINREYYLTNITYNGVSSVAGLQVKGEQVRGSTEVAYEFPQFTGYDPNTERQNVRQWYIDVGSKDWQNNIEYKEDQDTTRQMVKNNALIYLVLDQSNSIGLEFVSDIKKSVINFINILHRAYNQN